MNYTMENFINFCDEMKIDEYEVAEEGFKSLDEIKQKREEYREQGKMAYKIMEYAKQLIDKSSGIMRAETSRIIEKDLSKGELPVRLTNTIFQYTIYINCYDTPRTSVERKLRDIVSETRHKFKKEFDTYDISLSYGERTSDAIAKTIADSVSILRDNPTPDRDKEYDCEMQLDLKFKVNRKKETK